MRPEDTMLKPPRHTVIKKRKLPNGETLEEEVDMVTDYSWRNFFATINFAKIMQKLSKHRSHRIWMLVQYKSSVRVPCILADFLLDNSVGGLEAYPESATSSVAATFAQTHQESSAILWPKMEAKYVSTT